MPGPYMYVEGSASLYHHACEKGRESNSLTRSLPMSRKWFFEELGNENLHKMVAGFDDNSAQIICTFAYSPGAGHEPVLFQERTDVTIHDFHLLPY
jgi:inosine triphosphate pyrophosphatase